MATDVDLGGIDLRGMSRSEILSALLDASLLDLDADFAAPAPPPDGRGRLAAEFAAPDDGHWVTIEHEHVFIRGGVIEKGPAHLTGKKIGDLPPRHAEAAGHAVVHAALAEGHHSVAQLAKKSGLPQSAVSSHLAGLHAAGKLETGVRRGVGTYAAKGGAAAPKPAPPAAPAPKTAPPESKPTPASPAASSVPKPAPPAGPKSPPALPHGGHPSEAHRLFHERAAAAAEKVADPRRRKELLDATTRALARMPESAVKRVHANARSLEYVSRDGMSEAVVGAVREDLGAAGSTLAGKLALRLTQAAFSGEQAGGAYVAGPSGGRLVLDGAEFAAMFPEAASGAAGYREVAAHMHAHEFTHAIDGPQFEHSASAAWREAYRNEIVGKKGFIGIGRGEAPLTEYARTNEREGFAEFGRMLYASDVPKGQVEAKFPKCSAYFKAQGWWPQ